MNIAYIAKKNIRRQPGRSFCVIVVVMVLALFLFAGTVLQTSLSHGLESMSSRLGADIMIVPEGYDPHIDSVLLSGKPSTFYLPESAIDDVMALQDTAGIASISAQTFLATLRASCCSYPVQLVGIDYDSDFVVRSWLRSSVYHDLRDGEIIVGYHVAGWPGDKLTFFGRELTVAGRLDQTGMGFDSMVFMNRNTIALMSREAERIAGRSMRNDGSLDSVLMVKLKPGYDSVASAIELNRSLNAKGMYALFSKKFVNNITSGLRVISCMIEGGVIVMWVLSGVILAFVITLTLSERRRDFGIMRSIGATRGMIVRLCLREVLMTSSFGALLGVILGNVLVAVGSPFAAEAVGLPFLLPTVWEILGMSAGGFVLTVLTGIVAALWSTIRASRVDIQDIVKGV